MVDKINTINIPLARLREKENNLPASEIKETIYTTGMKPIRQLYAQVHVTIQMEWTNSFQDTDYQN